MPCPPQGCVLRPGISGPPLLGVQRARCAGRTDQSLPSVVRSVPPPPCPHSSRGSGKQGARVPPEGSEAPLRAPAVPSPPRHQLRCGWGLFSAARLLSPTHSGSVGFSSSEPGARTETKYIFLIISQSRTVTAGGGARRQGAYMSRGVLDGVRGRDRQQEEPRASERGGSGSGCSRRCLSPAWWLGRDSNPRAAAGAHRAPHCLPGLLSTWNPQSLLNARAEGAQRHAPGGERAQPSRALGPWTVCPLPQPHPVLPLLWTKSSASCLSPQEEAEPGGGGQYGLQRPHGGAVPFGGWWPHLGEAAALPAPQPPHSFGGISSSHWS